MSFTPAEKLVKYIDNFIDYVYNNIETMYGAENDNEHQPINIPQSFNAVAYGLWNAMVGGNFSGYYWGNGVWSFLYTFDVIYLNGNLSYSGFEKLGRFDKNDWDQIHEYSGGTPNPDEGDRILSEYIDSHDQMYVEKRDYPDVDIYPGYSIDGVTQKPKVIFYQKDANIETSSGLYSSYLAYNGKISSQYINLNFDMVTVTEDADGYLYASGVPIITTSYNLCAFQDAALITRINDDSVISNYITNNGAEHNYNYTYETENGDDITVYYGDNYVIYKCDDDTQITYDDNYNIINKIKNDTDLPVDNPTYTEKKYGPPVDPDADIEVPMDLNDAAYGAGMSHYYVTTTTSGVLDDISAAMSTWDINNTGKDLYRNLLSCRLTKVGPIPAENSTFVIYGEELQYNGAPISINKITGNPSMDLGEYEILPKFHDFRDYAPYTKIEMYIPYCGWVALPSHCMSSEEDPKIITGTLLCDIIAGTCKAVIKCNDTVVAEAAGFTAVDVPFVGENVGMKMAGIASSITSYGSNAAKTVGGIAGGMSGGGPAGAAAAGGVVSLLGSYAQLNAAFNANYTEICGKTGDGCNVAGLNKVYIKIQRPKTGGYEEPDFVPGDYGHTTGFLCMQKMKVSDCSGLIIASNADVSGIGSATDAERAEIKRVLETGLFVNAAPVPPEPEE